MKYYWILLIILGSTILFSCTDNAEKKKVVGAVQNITDQREIKKMNYINHWNLSKPIDAFSYHYFSSKKNKDQFQIFIPAGKVNDTQGFLLVQNSAGDTLIYQEFQSFEIINGYDLEDISIDSYSEMVKYLQSKLDEKINLESFIYSAHEDDGVLNSRDPSEILDIDLYDECMTNKLPVFIFSLGEESLNYYVYDKFKNKATILCSCC